MLEGKATAEVDSGEIANGLSRDAQNAQPRRIVPIAPVLKAKGKRSSLSDGYILLSRGETVDLEAAERFRMLRGQVERRSLTGIPQRVVAVTSAVPGEGKSVVSVNLARAFGTDPRGKTLIIDCDLRKPNVHRFFGEMQSPGLSDILLAGKSIKSVIRHVENGLDLIAAGSPVVDSTRTIEQPGMGLMLEELKKHYQYIVLDCPPTLLCSEPLALAQLASSTLLVVRSWRTEKKLVKDAVNMLGKKAVAGIVLNDCSDTINQYGYYGYYGYDREAIVKARQKTSVDPEKLTRKPSLLRRILRRKPAESSDS